MIRARHPFLAAVATLACVVAFVTLTASGTLPGPIQRVVFVEPSAEPAWAQRLALVDAALDRAALGRAVYEWREAYGIVLASQGWEPLVEVGDRAIRIIRLAGGSHLLVGDVKTVYLHALSRARAARSAEGVARIAEAFDRLGDPERAAQARRIAADLS